VSVQGSGDDVQRVGARTTLEGRTMTSEVRPAGLRATVDRRDRVRWGPVWAGTVVALATYLLLEMALLGADLLDADVGSTGDLPDGALLTVLASAFAFLLGGVVAGASMAWRDAGDGLLHGLLVWAAGIAAFVLLAVLGTGLALGTLGDTVDRVRPGFTDQPEAGGDEDDLEEASGSAALMLGATAIAAAVGGLVGSKLWPRPDRRGDVGPREPDEEWRSTDLASERT
jgi:hypothetical protein